MIAARPAVMLVAALGLGLGLGLQSDHRAWTELLPPRPLPEARYGQSAAYDFSSGLMIMFGGLNSTRIFDDTWNYDPEANRWTEVNPLAPVPLRRYLSSMAYDPNSRLVILFGGLADREGGRRRPG